MKHHLLLFTQARISLTASALSLLSLTGLQAANTFILGGDNDYALYTGDVTGTALTLLHENDLGWNAQNASSLTLPASGYLYAIVLNYGGAGAFSGSMNGTNIVNTPWEYVDIATSSLTGFPTTNDVLYDVPETELETALTGLTWADASSLIIPANTVTAGAINEDGTPNTSATHYTVPSGFSARVFRIDINDIPQVPEPTSFSLLALAGLSLLSHRKRA